MNVREQEQVHRLLQERQAAIAGCWQEAIAPYGFPARSAADIGHRLFALTNQAITALLAERCPTDEAEAIGVALVRLRYVRPAALAATQQVLARELTAGLSPQAVSAFQPRLIALLAEQEKIRGLLLAERQRAIEALREKEVRLSTVVTNAPVILFAFDRLGALTLAEGQGLAALGRQPGNLPGRSVWDGAISVPELPRNFHRALTGEAFTTAVEVRGVVFETYYAPLRDEQGAIAGVIGVATDVTEQVRARAAVQRFEAKLSRQEWLVLQLLARPELSYRQIGDRLGIEAETVRSHLKHIADKLGVPSRREAVVRAARERGLLPATPAPPASH